MSPANKPKTAVRIYERYPVQRSSTAVLQVTLDQVKKYASLKPLRRAPPRKN